MMESYSTQALPLARKLAFWNEISSVAFAPLEVIPAHPAQFEGHLRYQHFGPLTLAEVHSAAGVVQHTHRHVAHTARQGQVLIMPLCGGVEVAVAGRAGVLLGVGDLCLLDHASAYRLTHHGLSRTFCIGVEGGLLAQVLPDPQAISGHIIRSTQVGAPALSVALVQSLWQQWQQGQLQDSTLPTAHLAGCIAAGFLSHRYAVDTASRPTRVMLIKAFIEAQLHEPALGPAMIAAHMGISDRYLRLLWARQGDAGHASLSAYICRRRLDACAQRLADPHWRDHSITDIALRFGFGSSTQFSCAFRKQFGLTPREYRRHCLPPARLN